MIRMNETGDVSDMPIGILITKTPDISFIANCARTSLMGYIFKQMPYHMNRFQKRIKIKQKTLIPDYSSAYLRGYFIQMPFKFLHLEQEISILKSYRKNEIDIDSFGSYDDKPHVFLLTLNEMNLNSHIYESEYEYNVNKLLTQTLKGLSCVGDVFYKSKNDDFFKKIYNENYSFFKLIKDPELDVEFSKIDVLGWIDFIKSQNSNLEGNFGIPLSDLEEIMNKNIDDKEIIVNIINCHKEILNDKNLPSPF